MAHASIQDSSFVSKLLQHSRSHSSGDSEVSSCTLISPKPLKRRTSYKGSFLLIQPVFWQLFSFSTAHLAVLSQSTGSPAVLAWAVGRPTGVCACLHLPRHSQCSFSAVTQDSSSLPSDSHLHNFPFAREETPALCWHFRPIVNIIPHLLWPAISRPCICSISTAETNPLHLSMDVHVLNSLLVFAFGSTFLYKDFSLIFLFQPVPVSPPLRKHFLPSHLIFHGVAMCPLSCFWTINSRQPKLFLVKTHKQIFILVMFLHIFGILICKIPQ